MSKYTPAVQVGLDRMREMARGNYDLSWMHSNPDGWGHRATPGSAGLRLRDVERGSEGAERSFLRSALDAGVVVRTETRARGADRDVDRPQLVRRSRHGVPRCIRLSSSVARMVLKPMS